MTTDHSRLSRRALLGTAALGAAALGTGALAACSPNGQTTDPGKGNGNPAGSGKLVPPTYVPFPGVNPDKPGTADGVVPVFYNYPASPVNRDGYPLTGGAAWKSFQQTLAPKVPPAENKAFEAFQKAVGAPYTQLDGTYVQYTEKFQVLMASNDIPEFVQIIQVAQLPKLLEKNFTDLTDVLGGDGVKKYPGLANIPTPTWKIPTLNGRLWGIAQPRPPAGTTLTSRGDVFAKRGISDPNPKLTSGQDFVDLCKQLTNKDKNEFAMGADPNGWLLSIILTMMEAPNVWKEEGGKFIHQIETEQYKRALVEAGNIIKAGYLHPNSFSEPANNITWFRAGVTAMYYQSFVGWGGFARTNPEWNVGNVELPKWEGGGMARIRKSVAGYYAYVAIKKTDDKRLEYLLKVADYIASPFGTQQYLDVNYGVPGYNYNMKNGNPVSLPTDTNPGLPSMGYTGGNAGAVLFGNGVKESVDAQHDYLARVIPTGIEDASQGLYSEAMVTKGATMDKQQLDVQREIMLGQKPISVWDDFVKSWKATVGDQAAKEYAEAKAKA